MAIVTPVKYYGAMALLFVDLDDCRDDPAIQDLWMMLSGDRQQQLIQMNTLVEAYEEFCDFDTTQLTLIEPLCAMLMVHYIDCGNKTHPSHKRFLGSPMPILGTTNTWAETIIGTSRTCISPVNSG